jgi:hypothetical protein
MRELAEAIFEPIREHFGHPIYVSSFFRSVALNEEIGGSRSSQHCKGQAIDIDADVYEGMTNKEIFEFVRDNLDFDQLIWEYGDDDNPAWVHISYRGPGANRKQMLKAYSSNGRTKYKKI